MVARWGWGRREGEGGSQNKGQFLKSSNLLIRVVERKVYSSWGLSVK